MTTVRFGLRAGLGVGIVLALLAGGLQGWQYYRHATDDRRAAAGETADQLRLRIEGAMQRRMVLADALGAFVMAMPLPDIGAFAAFADTLMHDGVAGLMVMPRGEIDAMLAARPEQATLGRKLVLDPVEWGLIARAARDGRTAVSEPLRIEGRNLIAAYDPVHLPQESGKQRYWGVAIALFDLDRLQAEIEATLPLPAPRYAVRNLQREDGAPGMVAGDRSLAGRGDATRIAHFPGGTWEVAVADLQPAGVAASTASTARAAAPAVMVALMLLGLLALGGRGRTAVAPAVGVVDIPTAADSAVPSGAGPAAPDLQRRSLELEDQRILLRSTLESLDEGVAVFDDQGLLILWNSRFPALLEIDPICLEPGIGLGALVTLQGGRGMLRPDDVVLTTRRGHYARDRASLERRIAPSGRVVRVEMGWAPGDRTVVTLADETEGAHSGQVLAASEQRLRRILEVSPIAVVVLDRRGHALFYNERHRELLGLSHREMASYIGASSFEEPAEMEGILLALRDYGVAVAREMRIRRPDGARLWVSLSAQNVTFDGQKATVCHVFDITALKQAGGDGPPLGELGDVLALARAKAGAMAQAGQHDLPARTTAG